MRIKDLLEGRFNELDWIDKEGDNTKPNFDVADDLAFYMNNDDDIYRRHTYPSIMQCVHQTESKRKASPAIFEKAVREGYKQYLKKFPLRQLPSEIDEKLCMETCKKMHEEVIQHISDGKYKG